MSGPENEGFVSHLDEVRTQHAGYWHDIKIEVPRHNQNMKNRFRIGRQIDAQSHQQQQEQRFLGNQWSERNATVASSRTRCSIIWSISTSMQPSPRHSTHSSRFMKIKQKSACGLLLKTLLVRLASMTLHMYLSAHVFALLEFCWTSDLLCV